MRTANAPLLALPLLVLSGCLTPDAAVEQADHDVYGILDEASRTVTGDAKTFPINRQENTLRQQLLEHGGVVELDLTTALDVAAQNSREFAAQKEGLYLVALDLTREQHQFQVRWGGGGSAGISGISGDEAAVDLGSNLSASARSTSGTQIVAGFVNTFLKSVLHGGSWDPSSIFNLSLTQPLLAGANPLVVRETLTQAERNVIYAVRSFEAFREQLAVDVISAYLGVVQNERDLESQKQNYESVKQSREQIEALFRAGRRTITDFGRAQQNELVAQNAVVNATNSLGSSLDAFKFLLGLPVDSEIELTGNPLDTLEKLGVREIDLAPEKAIELALQRRYDYRTALDLVEDAARRTVVAADALQSTLDFSAAVNVPSKPDEPFVPDWSSVAWSAGFDLQLALDKLPERNAYRSALIALDAAIRNRESTEDRIKQQMRDDLREIQRRVDNYENQTLQLQLAEQRVDFTRDLYDANRAAALDLLDAQNALLAADIGRTAALVDYSLSRLGLLRNLEAVAIEPKGLRLDLTLPLPESPLHYPGDRPATP